MEIRVFGGSVLRAPADVIVNAANTELRHGGGLAAAMAAAAGPEFVRVSARVGYCPLGQAVLTEAGRLPQRAVIHIPTIDYRQGARTATAVELRSAVVAAVGLAHALDCRTLAFPLLGAGVAGLSAPTACTLLRDGLRMVPAGQGPATVLICAFTPGEVLAAERVFAAPAP